MGLIACGGEDGALECFDPRQKEPISRIHATQDFGDQVGELRRKKVKNREK